jgi:hypothetical protein
MSFPSSRRLKLFILAAAGMLMGTGAATAFVATPTVTQRIVQNPETAILVFMIPLVLLTGALILEVGRIAVANRLPEEVRPPTRRSRFGTDAV